MSFFRGVLPGTLIISLLVGVIPSASAATLVNRYSFTANANDTVGPAHGTLQEGATVSGGAVLLNGSSAFVDLPNGIIAPLSNVTIETWLTDNGSGNWARIFDFGFSNAGEGASDTGTNYLFVTPQSGSGVLQSGLIVNNLGGEQGVAWAGTRLPTGSQKHVVLTLNAGAQTVRLYVDGVLVGENAAFTLNPTQLGNTVNNWIGRSQWSGDAYLNASLSEFRIYDGALSAAEVQQNFTVGPDVALLSGPVSFLTQPQSQTVGELALTTFTTSFSGTPPVGFQWRRNGVNITGATNSTYSFLTGLTNSGAAYSVVLTNAFLGTPYSVTSSNAMLTVTADTTPPVLGRAASIFPNEVRVTFSEGVTDATGTNTANYSITWVGGSLAVTAARFGSSLSEIILTTAAQTLGTNYVLTVSNVRDRSVAANLIVAGSQTNFVAAPFLTVDIGNPVGAGVQTVVAGGVDVSASGSGLGGTSDQFTFCYQNYTNNFDVRVRVAGLGFVGTWTRAALLAREGLSTNAPFAASVATPGPAGCHFESRLTTGGNAALAGSFPVNFPDTWLRLRRVGNVFDGFASLDGSTWEYLGSSTIAMSNLVQLGFGLTAGSDAGSTTAQFRDFANAAGTITTNAPLLFEPPGPSSRRTALVISEIMYNPRSAWEGTNNLEFIELWNSGLITEDLTGHKLSGEIDYAFPANTKLAPGQFLVIAKAPVAAQSFYGVNCLGPYAGKLANGGGTVRLLNELGGILLEIEYDTQAPWPVAADGAGHSLVLSRPSYGENDPRAWSHSDALRGSPGAFNHYGSEPARSVVINEFLAHTDLPQVDYIELFNAGNQAVNLSGAWLSDDAGTNKYQIANGTTIPARGFLAFTQAQLGFALAADGEAIYLVNSNQTRVLDAVKFDGQENGVSTGRYPNGAPGFQRLTAVTQGTSNTPPRLAAVVINEIMYNPISRDDNDEFVEIHNRSAGPVNLGGWKLQGGISFTFASNIVIAAGGYVVVAENRANLLTKYPQLNATNTFGDYSGALANSGERIEFAMPDDLISTNGSGVVSTNIFYIPVDDVTYVAGGRWGKWSDGGGSSLELIDPDADNRLAANWADSDESAKAAWTTINVTDVMENGQATVDENSSGLGVANRFELFLQGDGEAVVDNVEFLSNGGANLVANGDFVSGTASWSLGGVLRTSFAEAGVGIGGSTALHLISTGRGDTGANKIARALAATAVTGAPNTGTMRAQVRWLKGDPYVLLRMRGNWMEVSQRLNVPANLGTPGLPNSRLVANAGPAITEVTHSPVLPAVNQAVVVTARANDPDGLGTLTLRYRLDPNATYTTVNMLDNGAGSDVAAGDGIYSATIPGQANGALVAFYVTAMDALAAVKQFPAEAPTREGHVRWGENPIAGSLGTYRLWLTAANISFWGSRERNANDPIDATFVYGNQRAVYNVNTMYSGSPFHTPGYNGPLNAIACDYEVNFRKDERFLGAEPFVLSAYDVADGSFFFNDDSAQVDITGNWIARKLGQQYNHRRHMHMVVNGVRRGTIYDDTQQPNGDMLDQYFPDTETELRKIEGWFEFEDDAQNQGNVYARLGRVNQSTGEIDAKRYRWNWRPRATDDPNNWGAFTNLIAAVNNTGAPNYVEQVRTWMDVPNFLRPLVTHHICGSWDSYGYDRGKNMFAAKPADAGWRLLMWDIEIALGAGGNGATDSIYNIARDPVLLNLITSVPAFNREYLRGFQEALDTALAPGAVEVALDERYAAFQQNGVPLLAPQFIKNYLTARRAYLLTVLPNAAFGINNPAYQVVTGSNVLTLTGTGPLSVENILVNSNAYAVTWISTTNWRVAVPLLGGSNLLNVTATDRLGNMLSNATGNVTANYSGSAVAPEGFVLFNEIQYQPLVAGAEFVELFNAHTNYTFDLSGWSVNGIDYTFPAGATLPPRTYLVLAEDAFVYNQTYGLTNVAFATYAGALDNSGETLTLFRPGAGTNLIVVDRVRYEAVAPWPAATNGNSLQLVDAAQDNSRVANWRAPVSGTNITTVTPQWVYVTKTGTLPSSSTLLYLYLGAAGEIYIDDLMLVAGSVPESGANLIKNGNFESALAGTWTISGDFTASVLSTATKRSGNSSLRLIATAGGSGNTDSIQQNFAATLPSGATYTLSFWYLQNNIGTPLVVRLSNSTVSSGVYVTFDPRLTEAGGTTNIVLGFTPGAANTGVTNLPAFPPLWLNEAQANNITGPLDNFSQRDPWAEIFNSANTNVSLAGYYLTDTYTNLTKWAFPAGNTASNGFTLVWCDNATNQSTPAFIHAGLALASGQGSLALTRIINGTTQVVDYLNYAELSANWSYGAVPDGQPFYRRAMFYTTPGGTNNGASAPLTIFINEWLADNTTILTDPADGGFEDWFELYNPGTNAVDVGGYFLTDNLTNKFQFQIPNNAHYVIPAGGYLLVWADNESAQNATNRADLHAGFALAKGGEALGLFAADGTTIDAITFGAQTSNVSEGRFPNGAANIYPMPTPTPRAANVVPNTPPTLAVITNRVITAGQTLSLTVVGSDADIPVQTLTYGLASAPFGVALGGASGMLTWTPTIAPATNTLTVVVADNGTPSLTATQSFTVVTAPLPALGSYAYSGNQFTFSWATYPGQRFQVEFKDDLNEPAWFPIGGEIIGTGGTLSFTNVLDEEPQRFFRLRVLP
jgi:hypothetical protein